MVKGNSKEDEIRAGEESEVEQGKARLKVLLVKIH